MEPLTLAKITWAARMALDGHLLRDALPYLLELKRARSLIRRMKRRWARRCFYPDCPRAMTGAYISPMALTYCPRHRDLAHRIIENEQRRVATES